MSHNKPNIMLHLRYIPIILIAMLMLSGCEETTVTDDNLDQTGGSPLIKIDIPPALVGTAAPAKTLAKATADDGSYFDPFRHSLAFTQAMIELVNDIIKVLNENEIPDSLDFIDDNGERVLITTTLIGDYNKHIEVHTTAGAKYLEVNYNEGEDRIFTVFKPAVVENNSEVTAVDILYDGRLTNPYLESNLIFADGDTAGIVDIYAKALYVELVATGAKLELQGGVVYHYAFGDEDAGNPIPYAADHAYMFQAIADTATDDALVNLYFPLASHASLTMPNNSLGDDYLDIIHDWVSLAGNTLVQSMLDTIVAVIPMANLSWDTPGHLKTLLETIVLYAPDDELKEMLALMNLTNPIAYADVIGYVAHGDSVSTDYLALGDPSGVSFTLTPADILDISIDFQIQ